MYKCKECGCEYKNKPDFCDCGNDEFDFEEDIIVQKTNQPQVRYAPPQKETVPKIEQTKSKTFTEQYPSLTRFFNSIDIVSGTIFVLCIILSFYVIFFAWNPKETDFAEISETETIISKKIPSIDSFWNNATPKIEQQKPIEQPMVKDNNIAKQVKNVQPKNPTTVAKKVVIQKNQTTTKQTVVKKAQTTTTKTQTQTQKQPAAATKTNTKTAAPQKTDAEIAAEKTAAAQKAAQIKQEYNKYKVSLRNTIGRKIDFTKVVGDGDCTVAFKISSSGKLTNRSFAKQSSNITLNDAVYAAMMSTPSYNPPPEGYNNETLNLNIRFYDGNFEITLK